MHFIKKKALSRRFFLKGAGYCIGLPLLDAMIPAMAKAADSESPLRVAYLFFPHGTHSRFFSWTPSSFGSTYQMPKGLASSNLAALKDDLVVIGNLYNQWTVYNYCGDTNDHPAASGSFLTGCRANWKSPTPSFTLSTQSASSNLPLASNMRSVDVMIAEKYAGLTKIPVMHLTPGGFAPGDGGTAHYSIDFRTYLSWKSANSPTPRYESPAQLFNALFGNLGGTPPPPTTQGPGLNQRKKSILDLALGDASSLKSKLGSSDRVKLDEYLSAVREVELRIPAGSESGSTPTPTCNPGTSPASTLSFPNMTKAYLDLIVLAFQCDQSRIVSYMLDWEINSRNYSFAGATRFDGHQASHGGFGGETESNYADAFKIVTWYANQYAYLINRLKQTSDANGDLLSQSLIHLGSGENTVGGDHPDNEVPMVIAGQGNGLLTTGRAVDARNGRISNLHLTMLNKLGINATSFGDSTGTITGL